MSVCAVRQKHVQQGRACRVAEQDCAARERRETPLQRGPHAGVHLQGVGRRDRVVLVEADALDARLLQGRPVDVIDAGHIYVGQQQLALPLHALVALAESEARLSLAATS